MAEEAADSNNHPNQQLPVTVNSQKFQDWRACLGCSLMMSLDQFCRDGCPNCVELVLQDREPEEVARNFVTSRFLGMVGHFQSGGWLKRATRLDDVERVKGLYAVQVTPEGNARDAVKRAVMGEVVEGAPRVSNPTTKAQRLADLDDEELLEQPNSIPLEAADLNLGGEAFGGM